MHRPDPHEIASQVLVNASDATAIPLGQVASIKITQGEPSILTENAQLVDYTLLSYGHSRQEGRQLRYHVAPECSAA